MLAPLTDTDPRKVGRYWLQGRLGAGGMGTVYLGFDEDGHPFAVKVIRPELAADREFRERFRREVASARRVQGNFVAQVRDADVDAERPWMATEYVDGVSLATAVADRGRLSGTMLVNLATGLADALAAIHTAGLVHRDLKPSNILLAWDGPKVIDFGIAHAIDTTDHTQTGHVIGTVAWMAPEQLRGERAGPAADVFSWAMCILFAATGHHPFAADTPTASALRMLREEPDLSDIPDGLAPLTRRALNRDPSGRPSAVELVAGLLRNCVGSVDLSDQDTRRVQVIPLPPPAEVGAGPTGTRPAASSAPATTGRARSPSPGEPAGTPPDSDHASPAARRRAARSSTLRRWRLAVVTVVAGIALGITTGFVVAVALRVAPGDAVDSPGAVAGPVGIPLPDTGKLLPTVAGLWTSGPAADLPGLSVARPPTDTGGVPADGGQADGARAPAAQPEPAPPNAAPIARSSSRQPADPEPEPTRPATTTPAKPPNTSTPPQPTPTPTPAPAPTTPPASTPPPAPPATSAAPPPASSASGSATTVRQPGARRSTPTVATPTVDRSSDARRRWARTSSLWA